MGISWLRGVVLAAGLAAAPLWAGPGEVRLVMVGDVMLDDAPGRMIAQGQDPFAPMAGALAGADLALANLECPVGDQPSKALDKMFAFRAHPRTLPVLARHFNLVTVANNHSGDHGREAFLQTLAHLDAIGLPYFGGGANLGEAHRPLIVEKQGVRIAFLGYNEFKPRGFEAGPDTPGIAWSEDEQVLADLRAVRQQHGVDLVIPVMHWGWEREGQPTERQRQLARLMIDHGGADLVIGGHPHVTQGVEYHHGKLILFSLGNFLFDGFQTDIPTTRVGWLLHLVLDRQGLVRWETREVRLDDQGVPHPTPGAFTPCGQRGEDQPRLCANP